jgi:outer membrane immunogenic protein
MRRIRNLIAVSNHRQPLSRETQIMKIVISSILASLVLAAPASAQNFDGFQLGISGGYNHDKAGPELASVPITRSVEKDSVMIGIFAGYDKTIASHIVLGAEAALNGPADNKLRNDRGIVPITIDPRLAVYLSARAGYLINDKTLLYVRGGCSTIRIHTKLGQSAVVSSSLDGWHAGAGLEFAISKHLNARVEYRYTDVGGSENAYQRQQALFGVSYRL